MSTRQKIILLLVVLCILAYLSCSKVESKEESQETKIWAWDEIVKDSDYQALSPSGKTELRERYFNKVIWKKPIPTEKDKEYSEYSTGLEDFKNSAYQKEKDAGLIKYPYAKKILGEWRASGKDFRDTKWGNGTVNKVVFGNGKMLEFYSSNYVEEWDYYTEDEYLCIKNSSYIGGLEVCKMIWTSNNEFFLVGDAKKFTRIK